MGPREGLWRDAEFRKLWAGAAVSGLGDAVTGLALPLTAVAVLGATPAQMGLLIAAGNALSAVVMLLIPLAGGPPGVVGLLVAARALLGAGGAVYTTSQLSLRHLLTPDHLLGRSTATRRFPVVGLAPLGAMLGGALGGWLGARPTLLVGALGMLVALVWVLLSPVVAVRASPAPLDAATGRAT